jgi:hypothetical protein
VKTTSSSISPLCKVTVAKVSLKQNSPPVIGNVATSTPDFNKSESLVSCKPPEHPTTCRLARELLPDKVRVNADGHCEKRLEELNRNKCNSSKESCKESCSNIDYCNKSELRPSTLPSTSSGSMIGPPSQPLPRIAEEKDSPTGSRDDSSLLQAVMNLELDNSSKTGKGGRKNRNSETHRGEKSESNRPPKSPASDIKNSSSSDSSRGRRRELSESPKGVKESRNKYKGNSSGH